MDSPLTLEAMEEDLCEYCECTEFGTTAVNTAPYNLCEGRGCKDAYDRYLEEFDV